MTQKTIVIAVTAILAIAIVITVSLTMNGHAAKAWIPVELAIGNWLFWNLASAGKDSRPFRKEPS